jgi:hypothetical protein
MTAVEQLIKEIQELKKTLLYPSSFKAVDECIDLCYAKLEMEKQQLKEMYLKGIENYDPTFKKKCEHCYITSADWKSQTCTKCHHRINL